MALFLAAIRLDWHKSTYFIDTKRKHKGIQREVGNRASVQNFLIFEPILSPSSDGGDLDDGCAKLVITRLRGEVGTSTAVAPRILLVRGSTGVSQGHGGRGWLSSEVVDS